MNLIKSLNMNLFSNIAAVNALVRMFNGFYCLCYRYHYLLIETKKKWLLEQGLNINIIIPKCSLN